MSLVYAFGLERPVIYVDLPRKVNNPDCRRLSCEPLEVSIRPEIGTVVSPRELDRIPSLVEDICADPQASAAQLSELPDHAMSTALAAAAPWGPSASQRRLRAHAANLDRDTSAVGAVMVIRLEDQYRR